MTVATDMRGLRQDLRDAPESKLREVISVLDQAASAAANQAILDPVRARVASLNLARPLRLTRLLFLPIDPLIVPPRGWRADQPVVPRTALGPLAQLARAGTGPLWAEIEAMIAGHDTHDMKAISRAGEALWPRAGAILAAAVAPADWREATGLPVPVFAPLAQAIGAVLRRGVDLRLLAREAAIGALLLDRAVVARVVAGMDQEPDLACAMIARVVLASTPNAAPMLRDLAMTTGRPGSHAALIRGLARGMETILEDLDQDGAIGPCTPMELAAEVARMTALAREIEGDVAAKKHRPRLKAICDRLSALCRSRFTEGLTGDIIAPLAEAVGPVDPAGQTRLESAARGLRALELAARKIGDAAGYDALTERAARVVRDAAAAGTLTPIRHCRLIEIIAGPEAAEAVYRSQKSPAGLSASAGLAVAAPPARPANPRPGS